MHDFSLWQMRLERWRRIRYLLDRAELSAGRLRSECVQATATELQLLRDLEPLWTFPSVQRFAALRLLVMHEEVVAAATEARRIVRALELHGDAGVVADGDTERTARYFTVLAVAEGAHDRAATLGRALRGVRATDDARDYELLPLASVEEALVAVRCNPWVEAVLLGERAAPFAERPTGLLTVEERRLLADAAGRNGDAIGWLGEWLHEARPTLRVTSLAQSPLELHAALLCAGR
jgi:hypothetical protein